MLTEGIDLIKIKLRSFTFFMFKDSIYSNFKGKKYKEKP